MDIKVDELLKEEWKHLPTQQGRQPRQKKTTNDKEVRKFSHYNIDDALNHYNMVNPRNKWR